jgi:hypothetical protein
LAATIRDHEVDVVVVGPLRSIGMNKPGTLQDVEEFMELVGEVRLLSDRRVVFVFVHHENARGEVSGAWEGCGDTLLHVSGEGNGRTRLYIQKARWSSTHHGLTLHLAWTEGEGFAVAEKLELDDDAIAENILAVVRADSGTAWGKVEEQITGVRRDRRREVRDRLLADGVIVNIVKDESGSGDQVALDHCPERRTAHLYLADDPTIRHLRPDSGADGAQTAPDQGVAAESASAPCAPPYKGRRGVGADAGTPPGEDDGAT